MMYKYKKNNNFKLSHLELKIDTRVIVEIN